MSDKPLYLRVLECTAKYDACDDVWWRTDGEYAPATFLVTCNDFFAWGCSDAEAITDQNIELFEQAYEGMRRDFHDIHGELYASQLFCARSAKQRPQGAYYTYLPEKLWPLFHACGPEREIDHGNPYKPGDYKKPNFTQSEKA